MSQFFKGFFMHRLRRWVIRELKRMWWEEICLRKIAKQRGWKSVIDHFHIENQYQFIKQTANNWKQRGVL